MKALTLTQPWATLVAIGAKKIETRSWGTDYRGPLAIHAAKAWSKEVVRLAFCEPFRSVLSESGYGLFSLLPRGAIVAICELVSVREITRADMLHKDLSWKWLGPNGIEYCYKADDQEKAFGDYSAGRRAWMLSNVQALQAPVPARGALSLWDWNESQDAQRVLAVWEGRRWR